MAEEDYGLYSILDKKNVSPKTGNPYLVFTPFKNHCLKNLEVRKPNHSSFYKSGAFTSLVAALESIEEQIALKDCRKFFKENTNIRVHGGRKEALKILESIGKFKDYN